MTKGPAASDEQHFGPFSAAGFTSWPPHAQNQFAELDAHNSGIDNNLWKLLAGMLSLGGLRTFEKTKKVVR